MTEATSLELRLDGQAVPARLALPDGPGPHPGVLVIHELWGLTADIERICERLATAGFAALAGELYGPGPRPLCVARAIRDLARTEGELGMVPWGALHDGVRERISMRVAATAGAASTYTPTPGFSASSATL